MKKYIKEKKIILLILFFLIFLTSSFDIAFNFEVFGFTVRLNQLLCVPLFIYYIYIIFKQRRIRTFIGWKQLCIWAVILLLFTFNTILPKMNIGYHLWLAFDIFLIFSIVGVVSDKEFSKKVFNAYILSFGVMSLWGFIEFIIGLTGSEPFFITQWWIPGVFPRINGFSFEPSYYATYMLIGWIMTRVLVMNNSYNKKIIWIILFADTIAIVLSSSRMGIIFMGLFEGINWLKELIKLIKSKDLKILKFLIKDAIIALLILSCYVGMFIFVKNKEQQIAKETNTEIEEGAFDILLRGTGVGETANYTTSERKQAMMDTLYIFQQSPILGKGLGGIYAEIAQNRGYNIREVNTQDKGSGMTVFVEILAASGIIGFIFFINYIIILILKTIDLSNEANKQQKYTLIALILSLIMELIILQFNQNILRPYLWLHIAVISMWYNIIEKDIKRETRIAVDARMIEMSGIGTYIQNLMKNNCYTIAIGNKEKIKKYGTISDENIIEFNEKIYGIIEQFKFPYRKLKKLKPTVLHIPHYNVPIFYNGDMVVTIHDIIHIKYKEFLPNKMAYLYANIMIWIATRKAKKIITVSENTKKDIIEYFHVNPNKIEVIYNGVGQEFTKKSEKEIEYLYSKYKISKDTIKLMYVGNLKPHKNLERLLEAFSKIKNKRDLKLIIVGKEFENYRELTGKIKELDIERKVIFTGKVEQNDLVNLYNFADIFIFPSLYEGFGLPILEAMACGAKVVCSNSSSLPEVGGKYVIYFDPEDVNDIREKIDYSINNDGIYQKKTEDWIKKFDWEKTAKKTKDILIKNIGGEASFN